MKRRARAAWCAAAVLAVGVAVAQAYTSAPPPAASLPTAAAGTDARPVLVTGEVEALDSQTIFVPPSNSAPIVLRTFLAEGTQVRKGDVVLRTDAGGAVNVDQLRMEREHARAKADSEVAGLEVAAVEAEKALVGAQAALDKAKVDATLPKPQIGALDYDRHQAELDRATRDLAIKRDNLDNARAAVARRKEDGALEVRKMQINEAFQIARLAQAEVRATRDGVVVHGYQSFNGERFDEGASAWPGNAAGTVLGDGRMVVTAWVLEADRPWLHEGQAVGLRFDALPGVALTGTVAAIAGAPQARPRWGQGRYFRATIALPDLRGLALAAGMSVLVEPLAQGAAPADAQPASAPAGAALAIEGEIASRRTLPVAPPTIPYIWQYKLAFLAPEGTLVQAGQPIAVFESTEVATRLVALQGTLRERERALDKLRLDQLEADRAGVLAQAEARSEADKAERKASLPKELIRRVDYDKLVIERAEKARLARLAQTQYEAQRRARQAERASLQSEVTQLQSQIADLARGQAALTVAAPRRGLVLHRIGFNGAKFAVGSQVWMGLSVATLADPDRLGIDAKVPEAQAAGVTPGQAARVTVAGARRALAAHVTGLGRAFHARSAAQPAVVRDVQLEFDAPPRDVKPGAAVQVELLPDAAPSHERPHAAP